MSRSCSPPTSSSEAVGTLADPRHADAPGGRTGGEANKDQLGGRSLPIIPGEVAESLDGALVLLVRTEAGRYRRRVFLTIASAQRAADRATEAGHAAEIVLCALAPVAVVEP